MPWGLRARVSRPGLQEANEGVENRPVVILCGDARAARPQQPESAADTPRQRGSVVSPLPMDSRFRGNDYFGGRLGNLRLTSSDQEGAGGGGTLRSLSALRLGVRPLVQGFGKQTENFYENKGLGKKVAGWRRRWS